MLVYTGKLSSRWIGQKSFLCVIRGVIGISSGRELTDYRNYPIQSGPEDNFPEWNKPLVLPAGYFPSKSTIVEKMDKKVSVIVTGFGPFREHKINASWEAVKTLSGIEFEDNVNLITQEIPVEYKTVSSLIPDLWKKHKPMVCVHVGVSSITNTIQLEMCAHNSQYHRKDISCKYPDGKCCVLGGEECLHTRIDVKKICEDKDDKKCPCDLETSCDAGRYLCEFIYYISLKESMRAENSGSLVLFVHVPPLDNPYSKQQLARSLKFVVLEILKQLS